MIIRFNIFLCALLLLCACGQDQTQNEQDHSNIEIQNDTLLKDEPIQLAPPARDAEQDSVDKHMSNVSPFLNQGCCDKEANREKPCCCESVLAHYKLMMESGDLKVAELSMTDPILADCRRIMPKEFDALENPPSEETDEELF